jgi:hypothetical protein
MNGKDPPPPKHTQLFPNNWRLKGDFEDKCRKEEESL